MASHTTIRVGAVWDPSNCGTPILNVSTWSVKDNRPYQVGMMYAGSLVGAIIPNRPINRLKSFDLPIG